MYNDRKERDLPEGVNLILKSEVKADGIQ
jgi:hypothetical protein